MSEEVNYRKLREELDVIMEKLQNSSSIDIEETIRLHAKGSEIIEKLEKYLDSAESKINKIKKKGY
ncbi:exodeoxyribonuclease VII small subunit [Candidatus Saccharibacteria bacterium]|nr:exodeoxyribonuclease VII small subunit [Candidatus Saccharibacteria bacterium]